jgi:hypothetical protein
MALISSESAESLRLTQEDTKKMILQPTQERTRGEKTMKRTRTIVPVLAAMFMLAGFAQGAFGQADPPGRVARLNLMEGTVSYLPSGGGDNDWVGAIVNRPLTTGDKLWADTDGRSELHIGSTAIRMDHNTGLSFLNLDDTAVQIRLSDGVMAMKVRNLAAGDTFEVDTPNLAFSIQRPGYYNIETHPDSNVTIVTVREGEGEVTGGGRSWQVISDQQAVFTGTDSLDYDLKDADAQPTNDFDRWAMTRDAHEDHDIASDHNVSPEMTGHEDLDANGTWQQVPDYGAVWVPSGVPVGWAPYRYGHWVWVAPWGWTWVEDEPWGFAPFHYGRWAYYGAAWVWVPGPVVVSPVYAPAMVAWVGGGFGVSVGIGGGVGWFPLGPHEVFVPGYRVSERYVTNINVTNTVVNRTTVVNAYNNRVTNVTYVNRNATTVVSRDTFVNARPVARNVVNVPARELAAAPVTRTVEATPERASVYGAGAHNAPHPPAQVMSRAVVAKQTPPNQPNHFAQQPSQPEHFDRPPQSRPNTPSNSAVQQQDRVTPNGARNPATTQQQTYRPDVKQAPAVHPPTPKEQQDVQAKQKTWQNAHPRPDPKSKGHGN